MENLIKTMIFVFAMQLCYAQTIKKYPSVIVLEKDTLVCFTTEQSKKMAVWNEQRKECIELRKNDNQKISELENIKTTQTGIISNLETEIIQHKKNLEDKDKLISVCEDEKKSLTKEIRKQKRGKWIAIIGGIGGVFLTTFILTL
jgi:septal ring factor EnvC (AmiA/AmiB activator)